MDIQKKIVKLSIAILVILVACLFTPVLSPIVFNLLLSQDIIMARDGMLVHFISVGQGDAIAINLPDGKIAIIDTGPEDSVVNFTNYLDEYVLSRDKDKVIDYLILTHADNDHVGGTLRVMNKFDVRALYVPTVDGDSSVYLLAKEYWSNSNINIIQHMPNLRIENMGYTIEFLGPLNYENTNDSCPMIKLIYKNHSFLFTGDLSSEMESVFIDRFSSNLDCDVLKVAHHGSKFSTSLQFVKAVTPNYSVISCGNNMYGHPTDEVINNLTTINSKILRTDRDGNIAFIINDYGINYCTGSYKISNVFNYAVYLFIIDCIFIIMLIVVYIKNKKENVNNSTDEI